METLEKDHMGEIHRNLLCQGPVELTNGKKRNKRHLSLFNDVLVVSSNLNKKKFKIKFIIPLNYLWAMDDVDPVKKNKMTSSKNLYLFWPTGHVLATFRSKGQKDQWYYFLKRCINEAKKGIKEDFSLQIFTEDIQGCDSPLCVTATNIDTVNDIIEKLLPLMRTSNREDYQLWFYPGHKEAPRALQGSENPYDIIMTHFQNTFSRRNSSIFTPFPALSGLPVKDLNSDAQGQFILKLRESARSQQPSGKKRPHKTKSPFWTACFHRGSVPHKDRECAVQTVNRQTLFGKELTSICQEGQWPTAILDILSVLREKGPVTEGIFRIPGNETSCKILKKKLDSGEQVEIIKHSVHDVASIFKDFLRNIEGGLLTYNLYNQWLSVPQKIKGQEKLSTIQSLLEKLPQANAAFLGTIFKIFHKIANNSSVNQMPSHSIAAEIAPHIFCLPRYQNKILGNDTDTAEEFSLVTFMIENSPKIFGIDIVAVWYETSLFHPHGAEASCSQSPPPNPGNIKETEHGLSSCPSGQTGTPGHYALTKSPAAPLLYEDIIDPDIKEGNVYTNSNAPSETPSEPGNPQIFHKILPTLCLDRMLPTLVYDMLSIIAEKGLNEYQIFRFFPEESHWTLKDKIYTQQLINWNEESVLIVASVFTDCLRNIQGGVLSSDFYQNCVSALDEESLPQKISSIQRIVLKMPNPNYVLLKELLCVLFKIKTSNRTHLFLDSYILSVRIAPYLLWNLHCTNPLFGNERSKKISLIEFMIDNFLHIFGQDGHRICNDIDERSDDIMTSVNTAGDNTTTSTYNFPQRKVLHD